LYDVPDFQGHIENFLQIATWVRLDKLCPLAPDLIRLSKNSHRPAVGVLKGVKRNLLPFSGNLRWCQEIFLSRIIPE
jgi:hypothetical protein